MANLIEDNSYPAAIYQIETTDPVLGGAPNEATKAGLDNIPHLQLAWRTRWLKARVDQLLVLVVAASTTVTGIVRLNTSTNSTSTSEAATPSAVKAAMDNADTRAPVSRTITTAGLATGGGDLGANRTITVAKSSQAQAEAGTDDATAMTPLRVAQAIARLVGAATTAVAGVVRLNTSTSSTSTSEAATPSAVKAAMDNANARAPVSRTITTAGLATGGGDLGANRTITVAKSSQAQAEAGADDATAMTPLRVAQAIAYLVVAASTTVVGIVRLSTSTSSTSTTTAATPSAVKAAMDNANTRAPVSRTITTAGLATGGGDLGANRTITVAKSSQAQAEAGTDDATAMTPLRVRQAMADRTISTSGLAFGGGTLGANRTITVPMASREEAEDGAEANKAMTPLRTAQAFTPTRVAEAYAQAPTFHPGTLAMLYRASTTALPPGAAVDGSALRRSSLSRATDGSVTIPTTGTTMPGTWKCICEIMASPGGSLGLYVRMFDA